MTLAVTLLLFFAGLLIGVPIAVSLGLASILALVLVGDHTLVSLSQKFFHTMQIYPLLAVPFFILAGTFMTSGGVAARMIALANAMVGSLRGGLAMASVLACTLFAAVSGSSPATVIAVGSIVIGGMVRAGYSRRFAAGIVCSSGTLGILIPPSIILVIYGAATETSVGQLFIAGIVPGIVIAVTLMIAIYFFARRAGYGREPIPSLAELWHAGRRAIWGLLLIFIVLGGIYGGVFTPTEAAAVSAVYALFVAIFIHRDLTWSEIPAVLIRAGGTTAALMFIVANAILFAFVLTTEQVPQDAARAIGEWGLSPWQFLLMVNVLLLIIGNFLEPSSVVLILAPILYPIALDLGIDPVHLGIIMVVNMEIGMLTPPVGLNLFVTSSVANLSLERVIGAVLPWLAILLGLLLVITYVPQISLSLVGWLY